MLKSLSKISAENHIEVPFNALRDGIDVVRVVAVLERTAVLEARDGSRTLAKQGDLDVDTSFLRTAPLKSPRKWGASLPTLVTGEDDDE